MRCNKVEALYVSGINDDEVVYRAIKARFPAESVRIETELQKVDSILSNRNNFIYYLIKFSSRLNPLWGSGTFELKQVTHTFLFPECLRDDFQNNPHRSSYI